MRIDHLDDAHGDAQIAALGHILGPGGLHEGLAGDLTDKGIGRRSGQAEQRGKAQELTPIDRAECRKLVASLRNEGIFTPPSSEGSIVFPGLGGGVNWGALSVDDGRGRLVVNSMRNPFIVQLVPRAC